MPENETASPSGESVTTINLAIELVRATLTELAMQHEEVNQRMDAIINHPGPFTARDEGYLMGVLEGLRKQHRIGFAHASENMSAELIEQHRIALDRMKSYDRIMQEWPGLTNL